MGKSIVLSVALLSTLLLGLVVPRSAGAAVAVDAAGHGIGTAATCSVPLTVGSRSNRALVVGVTLYSTDSSVASITYPGTSMTRQAQVTGSAQRVEIWAGVNPTPGRATVTVTLSPGTASVCGAVSFTGVDQTTPTIHAATNSGTGRTASVTVTSAVRNMTLDTVACSSCAFTHHTQTQRWLDKEPSRGAAGGSTAAGAESVQHRWAINASSSWASAAVDVEAAPVTGFQSGSAANCVTTSTGANTCWVTGLTPTTVGNTGALTASATTAALTASATSGGGAITPRGYVPPLAGTEGTVRIQFDGLLHTGKSLSGGEQFSAAALRDLLITVAYQNLALGSHTQRLQLYAPDGALYQQFSTAFAVGGSVTQPETRLPVGGTWITQHSLYGTWRVEVYLDQARTPAAQRNLVLSQ
jgi:hypothetical protein